jgi:transcriptional regulator with GAF, ATPase, and Fis domain
MMTTTHDVIEHNRPRQARPGIEAIASRKARQQRECGDPLEKVNVLRHFGEIVGDSFSLRQTLASVEAVAATPATVLVLGESGVGKELIARAIHRQSPRAQQSLVKVNCASIPQELFESEFFGHVKGSFTGAHRDRVGRFELANGGTLFLDEVAEIPLDLQAKLLRVLQEGQFERVGDEKTRKIDVRVVAATNRDLRKAIAEGSFREDLYYRLSVFPIDVPPLRERRDDIIPLAAHFLECICKEFQREGLSLNNRDAELLKVHDWPGNIRELRNVIERAVILSGQGRFQLDLALPQRLASDKGAMLAPQAQAGVYVSEAEWQRRYRDNLVAALGVAQWRVSGKGGAAELLGIKPTTLRDRMKSLAIRSPCPA